MKLDFKVRYG